VAVMANQPSNRPEVCSGQSKALKVPRIKADAYTALVAEINKRSQSSRTATREAGRAQLVVRVGEIR
jgi:hypothetical protein